VLRVKKKKQYNDFEESLHEDNPNLKSTFLDDKSGKYSNVSVSDGNAFGGAA